MESKPLMLLTCTECTAVFDIADVKMQWRKVAGVGGIKERYFKCPKCRKVFVCIKSNPEIRAYETMQRELERKVKKANRSMSNVEFYEWTKRQAVIRKAYDVLNERA